MCDVLKTMQLVSFLHNKKKRTFQLKQILFHFYLEVYSHLFIEETNALR